MSKARHTSEPWIVVRKVDWPIVGAEGAEVINCDYLAHEGGGHPPKNPYDLSLILAAAELLKAATAVDRSWTETGDVGCHLFAALHDAIENAKHPSPVYEHKNEM